MSNVTNNQTVGHKDGCCKITFPGKNMTTGKYAIYGITIGIPQEGVSYDDGNILSRAVETENVMTSRGKFTTQQGGNQTVEPKTLDIATNDDFNFVVNNISPLINRDTFRAILKGTKFKGAVSGQEIVVLGTQGQSWIGGSSFQTLDTFTWFEEDGKLIEPDQLDEFGDPVLTANGVKNPYEKSALLMVEFLYTFGADKKNGDRFAYCMPMSSTFTEGSGTSPNSHSVSMERYSDVRSIKEYYLQGGNMEGTFPITGEAQKSLTIKYVTDIKPTSGGEDGDFALVTSQIQTGTAKPTETAVVGTDTAFNTDFVVGDAIVIAGESRVIVTIADETNIVVASAFVGNTAAPVYKGGIVDVYYNTAGTWATIGTSTTFTKGTNIHASYIATNIDLDDASTVNEYSVVVIKTAGTNQVATLYDDELDNSGNFYVKKFDWNYGTTPYMEAYDGVED